MDRETRRIDRLRAHHHALDRPGQGFAGPERLSAFQAWRSLPPEDAEILVQAPHIEVAPYVGRYGWVTVSVVDEAALDQVMALISMSYDLVHRGGSRKRQR